MGDFWTFVGQVFGLTDVTDKVNEMEQIDRECQAILEREGIE